jgi:beta-lactamase regulating signal transducer with metallopeptidase domain
MFRSSLQMEKLQFVRKNLIITFLSLIFISIFLNLLPANYQNSFFIPPMIKSSMGFLPNHDFDTQQVMQTIIPQSYFSIYDVLYFIVSLIFCVLLIKYFSNIYFLRKLKSNAVFLRKINSLHILVSDSIQIPFCWSFIKNYFIALPTSYLEDNRNFKIALRHELQHIRQGDTHWRHFLAISKIFMFFNPFVYLWIKIMDELQEFSCDEAIIIHKKTLPVEYAECLFESSKAALNNHLFSEFIVGINVLPKSILYRRVSMIFQYKLLKNPTSYFLPYLFCFLFSLSTAFALNEPSKNLSINDVNQIILQSNINPEMNMIATPDLVNEINNIRQNPKSLQEVKNALKRMKSYQPYIVNALQKNNMPNDLVALPFIESGFVPLKEEQNPMHAAGIWQIIPSTGKNFGLTINQKQDDRLNTTLATDAALSYLKQNYERFQDWKLAVIAYEIGEKKLEQLISSNNITDKSHFIESKNTPAEIKKFVAMFEAAALIIKNPALLN